MPATAHPPQLNLCIRSCHKGKVLKISAVDIVMAATGRYRKQSNTMINDARNSVDHGEKAKRLLWDKHQFPGAGQRPTYVLTADEAIEFIDCLPTRHIDDIRAHIRKQFLDTPETQQAFLTEVSNKRPRETEHLEPSGYVYAAFLEGNGCKVCMTCQKNPAQRVVQFNTCVRNPYHLLESIYCANPSDLEDFMHRQLKNHRVGTHNRELFDIDILTTRDLFDTTRLALTTIGAKKGDYIDIKRLEAYFVLYQHTF